MSNSTNNYAEEYSKLTDQEVLDKYVHIKMQDISKEDVLQKYVAIIDVVNQRNLNAHHYYLNYRLQLDAPARQEVMNVKKQIDKDITNSGFRLLAGVVILMIGLALTAGSQGKLLFYGAIFGGGALIIVGLLGLILGIISKNKINNISKK